MLKLAGFAVSNYYNKVKLALLEKNIPFEEVLNWATKDADTLASSPLGKVPFLMTEQGPLAESQVLMDYIEARYPSPALIPADTYQAAKVRELIFFLEVHLELVTRRLYAFAFFGQPADPVIAAAVRKELDRNIPAFAKLAKFSPFLAGDQFTMADCAGLVHLPVIAMATKAVYGTDLLADLPIKPYMALLGERATVQKINADRKANQALMASRAKA